VGKQYWIYFLNSLYEKAYEEIEKANTEDEFAETIKRYENLFHLDNNEFGEKELFENIKLDKNVLNIQNIYRIGDRLYKIIPEYIVSTTIENYESLNNISNFNTENKNLVFYKIDTHREFVENNTKTEDKWGANKYAQSGNYRCYIELSTSVTFSNDYYYTTTYVHKYVNIKAYGKKKNWLGKWVRYKTRLSIFAYNLYIVCEEDPYDYLSLSNEGWGTGVNKKRELNISKHYSYYYTDFPHVPSQDVFSYYKLKASSADVTGGVTVEYHY